MAAATIPRYYAIVDQVRQQPDVPLTKLTLAAISVELTSLHALVDGERAKGWHQVGATKVASVKVRSVNLDLNAGKASTVQIDVCWDVSDVDVVDAHGRSVVRAGRPDTGSTRFYVVNYHYATDLDGGWRVASSQDLQGAACAQ